MVESSSMGDGVESCAKASVRVHDSGSRGKVLLATRDFQRGEEVFSEEPFLLEPPWTYWQLLQSPKLAVLTLLASTSISVPFHSMSQDQRDKILQVYAPAESKWYSWVWRRLQILASFLDEAELRIWALFSTALQFSSFDVAPDPELDSPESGKLLGIGLFQMFSRINHSCSPNCSLHADGSKLVLRATTAIHAGDEMTVNYGPDDLLLAPKHKRREYLLSSKEFLCECERCGIEGDDMRRFPCVRKGCRGYMTACQRQDGSQGWTCCQTCSNCAAAEELEVYLEDEKGIIRQVTFLETSRSSKRFYLFIALPLAALALWFHFQARHVFFTLLLICPSLARHNISLLTIEQTMLASLLFAFRVKLWPMVAGCAVAFCCRHATGMLLADCLTVVLIACWLYDDLVVFESWQYPIHAGHYLTFVSADIAAAIHADKGRLPAEIQALQRKADCAKASASPPTRNLALTYAKLGDLRRRFAETELEWSLAFRCYSLSKSMLDNLLGSTHKNSVAVARKYHDAVVYQQKMRC